MKREESGRGRRPDRGSRSGERREKNEREGGRKIDTSPVSRPLLDGVQMGYAL